MTVFWRNYLLLLLVYVIKHALYLYYLTACLVTVATQYQPDVSIIEDGFALAAWVQSSNGAVSGGLVSKISTDGTLYFYVLELVMVDVADIGIIFRYSTSKQVSVS